MPDSQPRRSRRNEAILDDRHGPVRRRGLRERRGGTEGPGGLYRFESRPDSRTRQALFAEIKHYLAGKVLDVSYRFMVDDWDMQSHTLDTHLRWPIASSSYLEPHVRYYTQSAVDFYRVSLLDGQPLPQHASADSRLGDMQGLTVGLKYGHETAAGNEWSARIELYRQTGDIPAGQLVGNQLGREQFPDLDAIIAQFSYRFRL